MLQLLATSVTNALTCVNADALMAGIDGELWWAWAVTLMTRGTRRVVTARCGVERAADLLDVVVADE
jgi:hypothetical protein